MAQVRVSFARYRRALQSPFLYGEKRITERDGLCLRLECAEGTFFSEAAPLPGHSRDDVPRIEEILRAISGESLLEAAANEAPVSGDFPPALRFALEGLALQRTRAWKGSVSTNALVPWLGEEATRAEIQERLAEGYSTVKLKIFSGVVDEIAGLIRDFPGLRFRLDANRALTEEALARLFSLLEEKGADQVEYLEEPLSRWRHPLLEKPPIPLAADECAADPRLWPALLRSGGPSVFVLKPTVAGGLFSLARKAKALEEAGKKIVYTSALEAEPGRRSLLFFLSAQKGVSGIATGFLFRDSYLADRPLWEAPPAVSREEAAWLEGLAWERTP